LQLKEVEKKRERKTRIRGRRSGAEERRRSGDEEGRRTHHLFDFDPDSAANSFHMVL
jgi:hypothetical protein